MKQRWWALVVVCVLAGCVSRRCDPDFEVEVPETEPLALIELLELWVTDPLGTRVLSAAAMPLASGTQCERSRAGVLVLVDRPRQVRFCFASRGAGTFTVERVAAQPAELPPLEHSWFLEKLEWGVRGLETGHWRRDYEPIAELLRGTASWVDADGAAVLARERVHAYLHASQPHPGRSPRGWWDMERWNPPDRLAALVRYASPGVVDLREPTE